MMPSEVRSGLLPILLVPLLAVLLASCMQQATPAPVQGTGSTLCYVDYQKCINPIFDATLQGQTGPVTCSAGGCHSQATGSGGAFKIYPNAQNDSTEMQANFYSARAFANLDDPMNSKLLLKPDATGRLFGVGHAGGNIFPTDSDACHVAIQTWISNRVDDQNAASCGICTAPDLSTCGYH
jgi:hypothetical protein